VRENAAAFITSESLAPILPIAAGPTGYQRIKGTAQQAVFDRGLELARSGGLTMKQDVLLQAFEKAFAP
jgi:hypothetical protein